MGALAFADRVMVAGRIDPVLRLAWRDHGPGPGHGVVGNRVAVALPEGEAPARAPVELGGDLQCLVHPEDLAVRVDRNQFVVVDVDLLDVAVEAVGRRHVLPAAGLAGAFVVGLHVQPAALDREVVVAVLAHRRRVEVDPGPLSVGDPARSGTGGGSSSPRVPPGRIWHSAAALATPGRAVKASPKAASNTGRTQPRFIPQSAASMPLVIPARRSSSRSPSSAEPAVPGILSFVRGRRSS